MMASFYYQDQNVMSKCCVIQIYLLSCEQRYNDIAYICLTIEATQSRLVFVVNDTIM